MPYDIDLVRSDDGAPTAAPLNPFSAASIADPYSAYDLLRTHDPIYFFEPWGVWLVTRHADVVAILKDSRFSVRRFNPRRLGPNPPEATRKVFEAFDQQMISNDAPAHTRLRGLVTKAFTPRVIESMRPRIQQVVDGLIDAVIGTGRMELIHDFAYPLPVTVVAEMLGVPTGDRADFKRWSDQAVIFLDGGTTLEQDEEMLASLGELADYFGPRIAEARRNPADNLLTALAMAQEGSDALTEEEIVSNCLLLLAAGHETTTNLIGNGLLALLNDGAEMERMRTDPSLIATGVDELLRYDSPVQWTDRIAKEDIEFEGRVYKKYQNVHLGLGAANRDPAQFANPSKLDVGRRDNRHVAFGFGPHFCLGAALARLEGQLAFETLLRRLPNMKLATSTIARSGNHAFRRLDSLPITFDTPQ